MRKQQRLHNDPSRPALNPHWRQVIGTFIRVLEEKDPYTRGHSQRVQRLTDLTTHALGWKPRLRRLASTAALLHDIGKIVVERSTLNNQHQTMNPAQLNELTDHPYIGARLVAGTFPIEVVHGILHHHERWDGRVHGQHRGYPLGLRGQQIPPIARVIAVCDSYDAMVTQRSYNVPLPSDVAARRILSDAHERYDPSIARAFVRLVVPQL